MSKDRAIPKTAGASEKKRKGGIKKDALRKKKYIKERERINQGKHPRARKKRIV